MAGARLLMISIYLFRSLRDSNATTNVPSRSVIGGGGGTRREYTRAHTHAHGHTHTHEPRASILCGNTLLRARRERLDGDAPRRLSLRSRGRILCRVVAVSNRAGDRWSARAAREMPPPPSRRLSCARRNTAGVSCST